MKRYQALILGAIISTGSFILGMNSIDTVQIVDGPWSANSAQFKVVKVPVPRLSTQESEHLDNIMTEYARYRNEKAGYEKEEAEFADSNIIDAIKIANRALLRSQRLNIHLSCSAYKIAVSERTELDIDMAKYDPVMQKIQMVNEICKDNKVDLGEE